MVPVIMYYVFDGRHSSYNNNVYTMQVFILLMQQPDSSGVNKCPVTLTKS